MRGLTLTQPWASLVACGAKTIETRSWSTSYRGPLAIHAAAGLGPVGGMRGLRELVAREPFRDALGLREILGHPDLSQLPRGALLAVVQLTDVVRTSSVPYNPLPGYAVSEADLAFGDFTFGRYGWVLEDLVPYSEPVPCKGAQGLWNVPWRLI